MHHSDRGVQYVSIRYTERLAEAGIEPSVGSRGVSYDNALAESIIGLYKTEVIRRRGPWRGLEDVEFATLEWVHWYNTQRLLEPIGNVSPVEYEMNYYRSQEGSLEMARLKYKQSPENPGRFKPTPDERKATLRLTGTVPFEVWNRLGTKILPKLRSLDDLNVGIEFSVSVSSAVAQKTEMELRQILDDLGLADRVRVERTEFRS